MTRTRARLPAPIRLAALLAAEVAVVVALHQLGRYEWMRVEWSDAVQWLDDTPPEDALLAAARLVALAAGWWMLVSTVACAGAALPHAPKALRSVRWFTIPALRHAIDGLVALSLSGGLLAARAPAVPAAATYVAPDVDDALARTARPSEVAGLRLAIYRATSPLPDPRPDARTYTVAPGDSFWQIAEHQLGEANRWPEIWEGNRNRIAAAGFSDPDTLMIGWILELPPSLPQRFPTARSAAPSTYTVQPGDTLSEIAADLLGDAGRVGEILSLNASTQQRDGATLADPDIIQPGWTLDMPTGPPEPATHGDVSRPAGDPGSAEREEPSDTDAPAISGPAPMHEPTAPTERPRTDPSALDPPDGESQPEQGDRRQRASDDSQIETDATEGTAPTASPDTPHRADDGEEDPGAIPGVPLLGAASALLAVGVLRTLRRRRARSAAVRPANDRPPPPSASSQPVLRDVLVGADEDMADYLDGALNHLAQALRPRPGQPCPHPRLVQVSPDRIDVLLDRPDPAPPPPWRPEASGLTWVLDGDTLTPPPSGQNPPLPALVTVGVGEANLLVDLEAYGAVALVGDQESCQAMARSMVAELVGRSQGTVAVEVVGDALDDSVEGLDGVRAVPSWDDVDIGLIAGSTRLLDAGKWPSTFAARASGRVFDGWAPTVWITAQTDHPRFRDALDAIATRPGTGSAIVVIGADHRRGLRIEVESGGRFDIPSLGLGGQAQILDRESTRHVAELVADVEGAGSQQSTGEPYEGDAAALSEDPPMRATEAVDHGCAEADGRRDLATYVDPQFDVIVRLCGDITIEGARYKLPPRESAVAAYLALRRQADIDQIRDAIWSGAGVSRKRVQNVVSSIRQSIGAAIHFVDHSRLAAAETLTTDVELIRRRLDYSKRQQDPDARIDTLRGGLEQVTGRVCGRPNSARRTWAWLELEDWLTHIESLVGTLARDLAHAYLEQGDAAGACWAARRGTDAVGRREDLAILLARGYALAGDEVAARSTLQTYERYLDELGVEDLSEELLELLDRYAAARTTTR